MVVYDKTKLHYYTELSAEGVTKFTILKYLQEL